jgi:acetyl-CoA carboxylase biotin carboxyl carrier protein
VNDLPEVQECLIQILHALPGLPRRLHLTAGEVTVELEWAAGGLPDTGDLTAGGAATLNGNTANGSVTTDPLGDFVGSPSVGTFYRSPEPGAPPFVAEGDLVRSGQQVAIVEVMKLMLPVEAERAGRVARILKADGESVEYGEPLIELATLGEAGGGERGVQQDLDRQPG